MPRPCVPSLTYKVLLRSGPVAGKSVGERYAAATLSTDDTRTAQYLNSGILPTGSMASLVRRLAAAS